LEASGAPGDTSCFPEEVEHRQQHSGGAGAWFLRWHRQNLPTPVAFHFVSSPYCKSYMGRKYNNDCTARFPEPNDCTTGASIISGSCGGKKHSHHRQNTDPLNHKIILTLFILFNPSTIFARYVRGLLYYPSPILQILNYFSIIYCDHSQNRSVGMSSANTAMRWLMCHIEIGLSQVARRTQQQGGDHGVASTLKRLRNLKRVLKISFIL
jgi:hypothetical protein